jgi:hypothetical protein
VRRKPTNWNEMVTSMFHKNENNVPVGRLSMIMSPGESEEKGAWTVVSQ